MPKIHLRTTEFTCSACEPPTKTKEKTQKFKETGKSRYIYRNKQDKACFQHDKAYGDFKDVFRKTGSDKLLCDKSFNTAKNPECDGYQRSLALTVYKFFYEKSGTHIWNETNSENQELAEELDKPIVGKFKNHIRNFKKVCSPFKENVCGADLTDMQLISTYNQGIRLLSCVISIYSKYPRVNPLNDKKGITISNAF